MITVKKISHTLSVNLLEFVAGFGVTTFVTLHFTSIEAGKWMWIMAMIAVQAKIREGITQTALVKYACNGSQSNQLAQRKLNFIVTLLFEISVVFILILLSPFMGEEYLKWYGVYAVYSISTSLFRWQMFLWQGLLCTKQLLHTQLFAISLILSVVTYGYITQIDIVTFTLLLGVIRPLAILPFIRFKSALSVLKTKIGSEHIALIKSFAGFGLLRETTGSIASRAELLIGGLLLSFSEVAWLGLAARYAQLLLLPNGSIQALVNARAHMLAENNLKEMKKLLGQTLIGIWLFFSICMLLFMLTASYWFVIIHGPDYKEALPLITVLLIATTLFAPIGGIFGTICHALNKPKLSAKVVMISSALKLFLTLCGLNLFGIWGGVWSIFIVESWGLFYTNRILSKHLKMSWFGLLKSGLENSNKIKTVLIKLDIN